MIGLIPSLLKFLLFLSLYYYSATLRIYTAGSATLVGRVWAVVPLTFDLAADWIRGARRCYNRVGDITEGEDERSGEACAHI
jgi:hypothetical protein